MKKRYSQRVMEHVAHGRYQPRSIAELAHELGVPEDEYELFEQAVTELAEEQHIVLSDEEEVALPPPGSEIEGTFRGTRGGFGFIVPDSASEHGDLFVPPRDTGGALTGDHVRAAVSHQGGREPAGKSPYIARVTEILQRSESRYVGNLMRLSGYWGVQVDGRALHDPVVIRDPHAKSAKEGDKVVIELVSFPDGDQPAEGVITEVLGERGEPDVETRAVMRAYRLPESFPEEVKTAAREASRWLTPEHRPTDREDLTDRWLFTIDPPEARDFDDAITIEPVADDPHGAVEELGVHVADVANYVQPGDPVDEEAYNRGNSVYLPQHVIPMLPEVLSNGVCSLQEGVDRLAKSVFIRYDAKGRVVATRFARSVVRSAKRLTYLEAQALIDDDLREARRHAREEPHYPRALIDRLKRSAKLAKRIRRRRFRAGMIHLDLPEVELIFDDAGHVVDAQPEDDAFTHTLIEMCMVEANEAVARLFHGLDVPLMRRIHPEPPEQDVSELRHFARVAGFNVPAQPDRKQLQELLNAVQGKPAQHAVHMAVLKTLSKAEYAPLLVGHFALASEHYAHFTSPIRRYPDLLVHRALDACFDQGLPIDQFGFRPSKRARSQAADQLRGDDRCPDEAALGDMGRALSRTERNAEQAERDLRTYLVLDLLGEKHLGDDFHGTVAGVTNQGVFVQLNKYLVDGFVPVGELPGKADKWRLNRNTGALVAEGSGRSIQIGDRFVVRVAKVQPASRQLELAVVEAPDSGPRKAPGKKKKRRQPAGARRSQAETKQINETAAEGEGRKKKSSKRTRRRRRGR